MQMEYEPGPSQPFGAINPEAPKEVADFAPLIGTCDCESIARNNDQTWAEPQQMTWTFKYIMNGMAVQDETLKEDGGHSGSIRQFIADSSKWYNGMYIIIQTSHRPLPFLLGKAVNAGTVLYYTETKKRPMALMAFID